MLTGHCHLSAAVTENQTQGASEQLTAPCLQMQTKFRRNRNKVQGKIMPYQIPKPKFYAQMYINLQHFWRRQVPVIAWSLHSFHKQECWRSCKFAGTIEVRDFCLGMIILHIRPTGLPGISLFKEKKDLRPPKTWEQDQPGSSEVHTVNQLEPSELLTSITDHLP